MNTRTSWQGGLKGKAGRPKGTTGIPKAKTGKTPQKRVSRQPKKQGNPFGVTMKAPPKGNPFGVKQAPIKRPKI